MTLPSDDNPLHLPENPLGLPSWMEKYNLDRLIKGVDAIRFCKYFLSVSETHYYKYIRDRIEMCATYVKGDHAGGFTISLDDLMKLIAQIQLERREMGLSKKKLKELKELKDRHLRRDTA